MRNAECGMRNAECGIKKCDIIFLRRSARMFFLPFSPVIRNVLCSIT